MNVMIPMAGRGSRFAAEGYRLPKPLINIVGRPMLFWLLDNLKFEPDDTLWVGIQQELEVEYAMEARLRQEYPALDVRVVLIDFQTRGAAETLFIMLQQMSSAEVRRKSISLDCDTIYFSDVLGSFRACESGCGSSFYFEDEGEKPIFSYIDFEPGTDRIVDIREKEAISRHANTGAYAFPCGDKLRDMCRTVLDNPVGKAGEFYTSGIIQEMIRAGEKFVGIHVPSFSCVGTPAQLRSFLVLVRKGVIPPQHKTRVCFDLDRLLRTLHSESGGETTRPVGLVESNKRLLREMQTAGHHIVAETSRARLPGPGNFEPSALPRSDGLTVETLRELGVCYDEIVFGVKRAADVDMGGGADNVHEDMEKEIGWCLRESDNEEAVSCGFDQDFITPRSFNRIACLGDNLVTKSAPMEYLRGELHFYRSVPPALTHLFPTLVGANEDASQALPSITITKIDGVSFSHLVTNRCITRGRFSGLLNGLRAIHNAEAPARGAHACEGVTAAPASEPLPCEKKNTRRSEHEDLPAATICANLHEKVLRRLEKNEAAYAGFEGIDVPRMSRDVLLFLRTYQQATRYRRADFVHGDPVFSNCLLSKESDVVFIDMRGALGDLVTTQGDMNYDLSKVYQSLCGYDFFILDKDIDHNAARLLQDLEENVFWPFVRENYAGTCPKDIAMLAASHFLSIVPLHEDRRHQERFLKACKDILARR
eukprot:g15301.t1